MKLFKIFLFLVPLAAFTYCTKTSDFNPTTIEGISQKFKSYTVFDSSSYWVYRNEKNSQIDTVSVLGYYTERRYNDPVGNTPGFYYESYFYFFESSETGIVSGEVTGGYAENDTIEMNESYRIYFNDDRYFTIFTPKYPIDSIIRLGINEGNYMNIAYYPTLAVGNGNYTEVYESSIVDYKNAPDTMYMRYFMAKDYGLIRYTKKSNEVDEDWILIGSNLTQP